MNDITYIVIDESGAIHQKDNRYFIIGGYITKQIYSIKSLHKKIEKDLKEQYPKLSKLKELKGCYLTSNQKAIFLNQLFDIPSTNGIAIIVDKKYVIKRTRLNENIKYNYFLQVLINYLFVNYPHMMKSKKFQLLIDNRNIKIGSLNSLEDYLNTSLGLLYNKEFTVKYRNSAEHREIQVADLISNVLFGYYNYDNNNSAYYKIPKMENLIISKFPYKHFEEPHSKSIDNKATI